MRASIVNVARGRKVRGDVLSQALASCLFALIVGLSGMLSVLASVASAAAQISPERWQPRLGETWQWQLTDEIDRSVDVDVYDVDLFDTPPEVVAALRTDGRRVICYISVGSWEDWRPDADRFPIEVIGDDYEGWPGEKWLDVRRIDLLAPVLGARLDLCAEKGFDGVEPDNIDGYQAETGFDLSVEEQVRFIRWLAEEAHARGLSIGLKNVGELAEELVDDLDWALTEDCYDDGWCQELSPFVAADKPVLMAEYTDRLSERTFREEACPLAADLGFSAILKDRDLDAARVGCPASAPKHRSIVGWAVPRPGQRGRSSATL